MDKKHKQHLLVTLIFTLIVTATLFFMYDDFVFQTYGEVVYYDYILKGENNQLKVEKYWSEKMIKEFTITLKETDVNFYQ